MPRAQRTLPFALFTLPMETLSGGTSVEGSSGKPIIVI